MSRLLRLSGPIKVGLLCCGVAFAALSAGCTSGQRDFYQAPPPEPSDSMSIPTGMKQVPALVNSADMEWQYLADQVVSWDCFDQYELSQGGQSEGTLIVVHLPSDPPGQARAEVRRDLGWGRTLSEHAFLESLRHLATTKQTSSQTATSDGGTSTSGSVQTDRTSRAGTAQNALMLQDRKTDSDVQLSSDQTVTSSPDVGGLGGSIGQPTVSPIKGRWFDLESAVANAGSNERVVELAVLSVDRWRYATVFQLRSMLGQPGMLIVLGDRVGKDGPELALVRIGRFGSRNEEQQFLQRLQEQLNVLGKQPHLPGSR